MTYLHVLFVSYMMHVICFLSIYDACDMFLIDWTLSRYFKICYPPHSCSSEENIFWTSGANVMTLSMDTMAWFNDKYITEYPADVISNPRGVISLENICLLWYPFAVARRCCRGLYLRGCQLCITLNVICRKPWQCGLQCTAEINWTTLPNIVTAVYVVIIYYYLYITHHKTHPVLQIWT